MIISAISVKLLPIVWPQIEPMLSKAVAHSNGEICISDIYERSISGDMLILTASSDDEILVALAIEKREFATGKAVLNVTLAGGERLKEWMEEIDKSLVQLAKDYNCSELYIVGRNGWDRALKHIGYGRVHTVVSKKIGD